MTNSMASTPAIAALMTIDDGPFLMTPSTSFSLDDVSILELRHKNRIIEQQLRKQTLPTNCCLTTSGSSVNGLPVSNGQPHQANNGEFWQTSPTHQLAPTPNRANCKAREALKCNLAGLNLDVWEPTWAVKRLKKELAAGSSFAWTGEGKRRALICTNIRASSRGGYKR
uniref:Uncharacterized protein n=1 Tax=Globodera pallida TaxID=36090 RepID=A0A183C1M7_GLOPA